MKPIPTCHSETRNQRKVVGWLCPMNYPPKCHSERSEESSRATACVRAAGFFTSFRMTNPTVHQQRSEESSRIHGCECATGFFAPLRMTKGSSALYFFGADSTLDRLLFAGT